MTRDERIIQLAQTLVAMARDSGLGSDDHQSAFYIARELLSSEWFSTIRTEAVGSRTLGEIAAYRLSKGTADE